MAASFRSANTNTSATTSVSVTKPTGVIDGDLLIGVVAVRSTTGSPATPSGWNLLDTTSVGNDKCYSFYKVASGEGASQAFTCTGATTMTASVMAYKDAHPTLPIDAHASASNSVSVTTVTAPDITTTGLNRTLLRFYAGPSVTTTNAWNSIAGYTEQFDTSGQALDDKLVAAAGAVGTQVGTTDTTVAEAWAHSIAITPAPQVAKVAIYSMAVKRAAYW
jgi:hypothetical protein